MTRFPKIPRRDIRYFPIDGHVIERRSYASTTGSIATIMTYDECRALWRLSMTTARSVTVQIWRHCRAGHRKPSEETICGQRPFESADLAGITYSCSPRFSLHATNGMIYAYVCAHISMKFARITYPIDECIFQKSAGVYTQELNNLVDIIIDRHNISVSRGCDVMLASR